MSGHVRLTKRADELELELLSKRAQDEPELELELRAIQVQYLPSMHVTLTQGITIHTCNMIMRTCIRNSTSQIMR